MLVLEKSRNGPSNIDNEFHPVQKGAFLIFNRSRFKTNESYVPFPILSDECMKFISLRDARG